MCMVVSACYLLDVDVEAHGLGHLELIDLGANPKLTQSVVADHCYLGKQLC